VDLEEFEHPTVRLRWRVPQIIEEHNLDAITTEGLQVPLQLLCKTAHIVVQENVGSFHPWRKAKTHPPILLSVQGLLIRLS